MLRSSKCRKRKPVPVVVLFQILHRIFHKKRMKYNSSTRPTSASLKKSSNPLTAKANTANDDNSDGSSMAFPDVMLFHNCTRNVQSSHETVHDEHSQESHAFVFHRHLQVKTTSKRASVSPSIARTYLTPLFTEECHLVVIFEIVNCVRVFQNTMTTEIPWWSLTITANIDKIGARGTPTSEHSEIVSISLNTHLSNAVKSKFI